MLQILKYSANYSYTNHNFVIQNLKHTSQVDSLYLPAICIVKNILQRGKPTIMSGYLQEILCPLHKNREFGRHRLPLIDKDLSKWQRIIRGDDCNNYFPAKKFYETLLPKHLPDYRFIQQLIIPEVPLNEITKQPNRDFAEAQADFYLPQAFLIIEIDGGSHEPSADAIRDDYTSKFGIKTVRIKTKDLEAENEIFLESMGDIKKRIEEVDLIRTESNQRKRTGDKAITLSDYKMFWNNIDLSKPDYMATAIIRFQLAILSLLEVNYLALDEKQWEFEIYDHDITGYAKPAIEDLMIWFAKILRLQKVDFIPPTVVIRQLDSEYGYSVDSSDIQINFSLLKRYTDEFQLNERVFYIRNDYMDEYKDFRKGDSRGKLKHVGYKDYDYFKVSTTNKLVEYRLNINEDRGDDSDKETLKYLLWNIFLQTNDSLSYETLQFNEGQFPVINNALALRDTIGLLPTGSGKSVCFQLAAILQPAVSFVVCPTKSLMYDQKADLIDAYFSRINQITSDDNLEEKDIIQREFSEGKYLFIYVSPERFQIKTFRDYFSRVNEAFSIAYAVIDEVHCLSEWGHDFRTAYLNLSSTITKLCSKAVYVGLTATASLKVLKDIKLEFNIQGENVKTPNNYTREELEFYVIDDRGSKLDALINELKDFDDKFSIFNSNGNKAKCGIIFTQTISNKKTGCYPLATKLNERIGFDVGYFSGEVPKVKQVPIMRDDEFQLYKREVQDKFKNNELILIVATKAFGMGVNKSNVYYTIHYGIPPSMEALYQEAGRAGRDKKKFIVEKAKCCVLLERSANKDILEKIWAPKTMFPELKELADLSTGDIKTNLFLFTRTIESVKDEGQFIYNIFRTAVPNQKNAVIKGDYFKAPKPKVEKAIYRLKQLGIVEDWTIKNFKGGGIFEVDYTDYTDETIKDSLFKTISKYDSKFSFDNINSDPDYSNYSRIINLNTATVLKHILFLLLWSYDNFAYTRRESLKNVYEICCSVAAGELSKAEFKNSLEFYFKITDISIDLQSIADVTSDYSKWFNVFYDSNGNILLPVELESLKYNLSRFLESYMYNTGLDTISGLLRLLVGDYENSDGRNRLESSLEKIATYEPQIRNVMLENMLKIGKHLDEKNAYHLSKSVIKFINDKESIMAIHAELNDEYSAYCYIKSANEKIRDVGRIIYGKLGQVG